MELYFDESGNLGKKDRYFVIAMLLPVNKKRIKNFTRRFCAKLGHDEIKASRLDFVQKQNLIHKLSKIPDNKVSYIVADKLKIESQKLLGDTNLCFNYLFMHLVKNVVSNAKEDVNMLIDEHTIKVGSINSLKDYLRIKAYTEWGFEKELNIFFTDSKNSKLVQTADLVANTVYARYNYDRKHLYNMLNISESIQFPYKKFGK
ncbi:MAG: DUF3800 domain-containing protein [Patescibacteria group bacterium]|nr:DUF3800 domain-containing protein [Patescibacteria group bacterium]